MRLFVGKKMEGGCGLSTYISIASWEDGCGLWVAGCCSNSYGPVNGTTTRYLL